VKLARYSFLLLLAAMAGCSRTNPGPDVQAAANVPPPVVTTAAAEVREMDRAMMVTGSLVADESVNLGFEVPGTLLKADVDFGHAVRQGQVIAELDTRELTLHVQRSRAALSQALARVGLAPGRQEDPDSTPAMRQAQAMLEDARFRYQNAVKLVESGDISRERFNELEKLYRAREAAWQATRDELRTQLAGIEGLRAEVKLAEKRLSDATMRAPFDGAVTARLASPGQFLAANAPLYAIVKSSPLRLRADIPESAVGGVRPGTSLSFTTDAAPGRDFRAVVRQINPALDPRSRSLAAEARLVEQDARLKPGMFVQVRVVVEAKSRVVVVPKEAVYSIAGLTKVFVVRNGVVVEHKIPPGETLGGWIVMPDAVQPGDRVATSNLSSLIDGMKVSLEG
jgi:RND family efflux transporter MFP subunit